MILFGKSEYVYMDPDKGRWQRCRAALKAAGIHMEAAWADTEMPVGGCGSKLDIRDPLGKRPKGNYYIAVKPADAERARAIVGEIA